MVDKDKIWSDVKKGIKDTVTYVSEKTEELTAIGRIKLDIAGLNRKIDKKYQELGTVVFSRIEKEEGVVLDADAEVKTLINEISDLKKQKSEKEAELEEVKKKEKEADTEEKIISAEDSAEETTEATTDKNE